MSVTVAPEAALSAVSGVQVRAALARAGGANPFLGLPEEDGTGDSAPSSTLRHGDAAARLVDAVAAWLGPGAERRVAASMVVLGYAARLVGPAVAVLLRDGVLVDLRPEAVRYSYVADRGFRLSVVEPAGWAGPAPELRRAWRRDLVDDHLALVVTSVRAVVSLSPALLWGNVASGLAGALISLARAGDVPEPRCLQEGQSMLDYGPLRDSGRLWTEDGRLRFRRRTCCLFYRLEGGGYCGDCPLPTTTTGDAR